MGEHGAMSEKSEETTMHILKLTKLQ